MTLSADFVTISNVLPSATISSEAKKDFHNRLYFRVSYSLKMLENYSWSQISWGFGTTRVDQSFWTEQPCYELILSLPKSRIFVLKNTCLEWLDNRKTLLPPIAAWYRSRNATGRLKVHNLLQIRDGTPYHFLVFEGTQPVAKDRNMGERYATEYLDHCWMRRSH